jgi:hypothetical protein
MASDRTVKIDEILLKFGVRTRNSEHLKYTVFHAQNKELVGS